MRVKDMKQQLYKQKVELDKWHYLINNDSPILRSIARREGLIE